MFVPMLFAVTVCNAILDKEPTLMKPAVPSNQQTLDQLPLLPQATRVYEFSSRNKKGLNGDAEWHLYRDEHGDAVVLDVQGPGCIKSIWETDANPTQSFKFYFDGAKEPIVVPVMDLYQGKSPLFPPSLSVYLLAGRWNGDQYSGNSFAPIPFAKSLKVSLAGIFSFYHFMVEKYADGTEVKTFDGKDRQPFLQKAFKEIGEELNPHPEAEVVKSSSPGIDKEGWMELLNVEKAGTVCQIIVEGDCTEEFINNVEIVAKWDDDRHPQVYSPIGIFCGCAVRPEEVRSMPTKVEKLPNGRIRLTNYLRMPFWRHGVIGLTNRQEKNSGPISAEVRLIKNAYKEDKTGYFYANYRDGRTEMGRDWLFADAIGTGKYLGSVQTMHGMHYCEGDEHITIDGTGMPQVNGTGSEDYYLGCYWPNRNFNLPFAGCVGDISLVPGPACYFRFHLEAPINFYSSFDARIQHGGNSDIVSHYRSCAFYYLRKMPAMRLTDFIDVANEASEKAHSYRSAGSILTGLLDASYEGNASTTTIRDDGRAHTKGSISFSVAVDPKNNGALLRRRLDQNTGRQSAEVYVDGVKIGVWYHADQNSFLRWWDDDFEIPASTTKGKSKLAIRLKVLSPINDFRYEAFSYVE